MYKFNKTKLANELSEIRSLINSRDDNLGTEEIRKIIEEHLENKGYMKNNGRFDFEGFTYLCDRFLLMIKSEVSIIEPMIKDDNITEIMVNGVDQIFIEKRGKIVLTEEEFLNKDELEKLVRKIASRMNREITEMNPILDARLEDGSRINAVNSNIALNGPILTIRKFPKKSINMEDLIRFGTITKEAAQLLGHLVEKKYNIFLSGGTSSGKTTFLNALSAHIGKEERIITIEDCAELQIEHIPNIVKLECRNSTSNGVTEIGMDKLIKTSLRMRPDRIIVGEVRSKEIIDMLQAMNTGHDGSLSTGHGNGVQGMLRRLEAMYMQGADFDIRSIRSQIVEGIDIMVHLSKMSDSSRKVLEISEIIDVVNNTYKINTLFIYDNEKGLYRTKNKMQNTKKLFLN